MPADVRNMIGVVRGLTGELIEITPSIDEDHCSTSSGREYIAVKIVIFLEGFVVLSWL